MGSNEFYKILKDNMGSRIKDHEFDRTWTHNAFSQIVWKLACYEQLFEVPQCLSMFNILHNLVGRLQREFPAEGEGKKSFFQKVLDK